MLNDGSEKHDPKKSLSDKQAKIIANSLQQLLDVLLPKNSEMAAMLNAIQSRTNEILSAAFNASKVISELVASIDFDLIQRIASFPEEQRKAFASCHPRLVEHGWLMLYWMPVDIIGEINRTDSANLSKVLQVLYFDLIHEDNYSFFDRLLSNVENSSIMKDYFRTVRTAVDLFKGSSQVGLRNYHRAIVPSLLPVIDGSRIKLARRKFGKEGAYNEFIKAEQKMLQTNTSKHGKVHFQDVIKKDVTHAEKIIKSSSGNSCWLGASELITTVFDNRILDHPILNRNAILHGRNTKYGSRANSLRLFLLINFLLEVETELQSIEEYSEKDIFLA